MNLWEGVLITAREELGHGELGGDNQGPDVDRYRGGRASDEPWCAYFASYCVIEAANRLERKSPIGRIGGARRLYKALVAAGGVAIPDPEPGCGVLYARGLNPAKGHFEWVERIVAAGILGVIAGNVGAYPSRVHRLTRDVARLPWSHRVLGYVRLPP